MTYIKNQSLKLILGQQTVSKLASIKVLLVGAGGIGCQVVKNVTRIGVKSMTVVDCDRVEVSNLNRQFYFRKEHVGRNKAEIIKNSVKELAPQLQIQAICGNLYDAKTFNDHFFCKFDVIISALDSAKAREYLAAQATKHNKPMVDAGTMSYYGQAYATIRFLTSCHNCEPSKVEVEDNAACLVRSRPERPVHCGMYAKNFYQSFFGGKGETMSQKLSYERLIGDNFDYEDEKVVNNVCETVFRQIFEYSLLENQTEEDTLKSTRKLKLQQAWESTKIVQNPPSFNKPQQRQKQLGSPFLEDRLWSLKQYTQQFFLSFSKLLRRREQHQLPCDFDKDDDDCMLLVHCITNLRTFNFINPTSSTTKLQYLTLNQTKDIVGKVMPAIASTNAIAAALQIRQTINIVNQKYDMLRLTHFTNQGEQRLSPCFQGRPLTKCQVCSERVVYAKVRLNMDKVTFGQFQEFAEKELFSEGRDLCSGSYVIVRNSRKKSSPNKQKKIRFVEQMIQNGVLPVTFRPTQKSPLIIHITIYHSEGTDHIELFDTPSKAELQKQIQQYFKRVEEETILWGSELNFTETFES